ncbi:PIG-L deacetylase family protein [Mycobacterium sp. RTGN5]|uniref:PIG-L deacetylase family protein n=1 Tax=Mycobacterium sp. RTGN5 TaxID=3016522 RepID=UPI0029C6A580|nr:PIG-L family deacetylase [Mycobacterium sp. RTGN5]
MLCVVGHPDDEVLGCGATLAKAVDLGADVRILLPVHRTDPRGREHWDEIVGQFHDAAAILGVEAHVSPNTLSEEQAETDLKRLHELVAEQVAWSDVVITHWPGDVHQVHQQVSRAVEIATRPFRLRRTVLLMEVRTSTDQAFASAFNPGLFVDIDESQARRKLDAMAVYRTEQDPGRRPEDLERHLRERGVQSGTTYAEAFVVARAFL